MEDTLQLIEEISSELREQFKKDYIKIRVCQRKMLGWAKVHQEFNEKIHKARALHPFNNQTTEAIKQLQPNPVQESKTLLQLMKQVPIELREWILREYIKFQERLIREYIAGAAE